MSKNTSSRHDLKVFRVFTATLSQGKRNGKFDLHKRRQHIDSTRTGSHLSLMVVCLLNSKSVVIDQLLLEIAREFGEVMMLAPNDIDVACRYDLTMSS